MKEALTQERLKHLVTYDPETGMFIWNKNQQIIEFNMPNWRRSSRGAIQIESGKVRSRAKLAWLYVTGNYPDQSIQIRFVDGDRTNLRFNNLYEHIIT